MKKFTKSLIGLTSAAALMSGCMGGSSSSIPTYSDNCSEPTASILVSKVTGDVNDMTAMASAWEAASCAAVTMYPQKTITTNDKTVNALMADAKAVTANVKALSNGSEIAFMVVWPDADKSVQESFSSTTFSDGFALQFAKDSKDATKLPYVGMGSDGRPVAIYLQKAGISKYEPNGNGEHKPQRADQSINKFGAELDAYHKEVAAMADTDYQKAFVSEGFRSMTEVRDAKDSFKMDMAHGGSAWRGTFSKKISDDMVDLSGDAFPITLAVWDGKKANRDGQKLLSSWTTVKMSNTTSALETELTMTVTGDVVKGKELAINECGSCHRFDDVNDAGAYMAPNLSTLGGQASVAYIKESIIDPSAVVVPGYNRNAHPNDSWYELEDGKRVSAMTPIDYLEPAQLNDIIAYFQSLK